MVYSITTPVAKRNILEWNIYRNCTLRKLKYVALIANQSLENFDDLLAVDFKDYEKLVLKKYPQFAKQLHQKLSQYSTQLPAK